MKLRAEDLTVTVKIDDFDVTLYPDNRAILLGLCINYAYSLAVRNNKDPRLITGKDAYEEIVTAANNPQWRATGLLDEKQHLRCKAFTENITRAEKEFFLGQWGIWKKKQEKSITPKKATP